MVMKRLQILRHSGRRSPRDFWAAAQLLCSSLQAAVRPVNDVCAVIVVRNGSCEAKSLGQLKMLLILVLRVKTKQEQTKKLHVQLFEITVPTPSRTHCKPQ